MIGFCKPISSKKRFLPNRQLNKEFSFTIFEKANLISDKNWNELAIKKDLFLTKEYLEIIENTSFAGMKPRYISVYNKKELCGILYFQIVDFDVRVFSSMVNVENLNQHKKLLKRFVDAHKNTVLLRLITCGNNLVSGDFGFAFDEKINSKLQLEILMELTEIISEEDKLKRTISAVLIKDFEEPLQPKTILAKNKMTEFFVEPNLVVSIPAEVSSIEDYLQLFSKKYRNRAKSVFKKMENIEVRNLNKTEIEILNPTIYSLYENIFNEAKFKLLKLPTNYFSELKNKFENQFSIHGFFQDGNLIAFCSYFKSHATKIEAHYIGFDYELNKNLELYQNILYELIKVSIHQKVSQLNLGRTAAEIKTTVGAVPKDLICYIKPQNTISKILQKPFINLLAPSQFIPRNPFKELSEVVT